MTLPWFQRDTGAKVHLLYQDCECHQQGRPYCFGCLADSGYEEHEIRYNQNTVKPKWFAARQKTHFTQADLRFLAGLPEVKPYYPKKRVQRSWQRVY